MSGKGLQLMVWIAEYFTKNNPCSKIDFTLSNWHKVSKYIPKKPKNHPKNPKIKFLNKQSISITQWV
jgi:hypothetical protein